MKALAHPDALRAIAAQLYDGVLDAGQWYAALDAIRSATGGALFYHFAVDLRSLGVVASLQSVELAPDRVRECETPHATHDERISLVMALPIGQVLFAEHFTPRQLSDRFIDSDGLPALGYRHAFSAPLHDDGHTREFLSIIRAVDRGAFGAEERALITHLMPDLQRAARLRARMAGLAVQAAWGQAALDTLTQAVVLVDAGCRVHCLNQAARLALAQGGGLSVRQGLLCASASDLHERLVRAIALACGCDDPGRASVVEAAPERPGLQLNVLPLQPCHPLAAANPARAHALLVWCGPQGTLERAQLGALLGLTDTEAGLALQLAQGRTLKQFAQAQPCSWHTARTHAKNLLRKTGLHRQAEVVVLVRALMQAR